MDGRLEDVLEHVREITNAAVMLASACTHPERERSAIVLRRERYDGTISTHHARIRCKTLAASHAAAIGRRRARAPPGRRRFFIYNGR